MTDFSHERLDGCSCGEREAINRYGHGGNCKIHNHTESVDATHIGTMVLQNMMMDSVERMNRNLRAENVRLKKALEEIAQGKKSIEEIGAPYGRILSDTALSRYYEDIALKALKGSSE
jgi:hypothetical protein